MVKKLSIIVASILLFSHVAHAQGYETKGNGAVACSEYLDLVDNETIKRDYMIWANGYLTAYNVFMKLTNIPTRNFKFLTDDTIEVHMNSFCKDNPDDPFLQGLSTLFQELPINQQ